MKTREEIKAWLLDNCINEYGNLDLNGLDFTDFDGEIDFRSIKAKHINNYNQEANYINNHNQEAKTIFNDNQKANYIYNHNQQSKNIYNENQQSENIYNENQKAVYIDNSEQTIIKPKKKVTLELTDEQLEKIKELLETC